MISKLVFPFLLLVITRICNAIQNCTIESEDGMSCVECEYGFYPTNNECQEITGCEVSDGRTNICQQCYNKYYLLNGMCSLLINCETSDLVSANCLKCETGFYPDVGGCYKAPQCEEHIENSILCQKCKSGYNFQSDGYCEQTSNGSQDQAFCLSFDQNKVDKSCKNCYPCFNNINGRCEFSDNGCVSPFENECKVCLQGHCNPTLLSDCLIIDTFNEKCIKCKDGFELDNKREKCIVSSIQNCLILGIVQDKKVCAKCISGYFYADDNTCKQNPTNCKDARSVNSNVTCISCKKGYFLNPSNTCQSTNYNNCVSKTSQKCCSCIQPYVIDEGDPFVCKRKLDCLLVSSEKCILCSKEGFYIDDQGYCKKINNCLLSDGINNICLLCLQDGGFQNINGICQKISSCLYSDGQSLCYKCFPMHYMMNDNCIINTSECSLTDGINCLFCTKGLFLRQDTRKCLKRMVNCLYQQIENECLACIEGFEGQKCTKKCPSGQYLDSSGSCVEQKNCNVPNCQRCETDINNCEICLAPFVLQNSKCQNVCNVGFFNDDGKCKPCSRGCIECTSSKSCTKCTQGWYRIKKQ